MRQQQISKKSLIVIFASKFQCDQQIVYKISYLPYGINSAFVQVPSFGKLNGSTIPRIFIERSI